VHTLVGQGVKQGLDAQTQDVQLIHLAHCALFRFERTGGRQTHGDFNSEQKYFFEFFLPNFHIRNSLHHLAEMKSGPPKKKALPPWSSPSSARAAGSVPAAAWT
jgi:hypothetical protein